MGIPTALKPIFAQPAAGRPEIMGSTHNSGNWLPTQRGVGSSTSLKTKFQIY